MFIGCQASPMHCGMALRAQFLSNSSHLFRKAGTEASLAPSWNWLPLLVKGETKLPRMKSTNYAEEKSKTKEDD